MWTDHTEYEEYQKLQPTVVRYQQNNTLGKISSNRLIIVIEKNIEIFFSIPYVDYCDVFISCLDSHSDGTHSLQRIHWGASMMLL